MNVKNILFSGETLIFCRKCLVVWIKSCTFAIANEKDVKSRSFDTQYRGVEQLVARQAHNLEVARSSPASATNIPQLTGFQLAAVFSFVS